VKLYYKKLTACIAALLLLMPIILSAQNIMEEKRIALIGFENMDEGDEHDYLTSLITAVIREDLSHTEGIILLERNLMRKVLDEQKMQISGLFEDSNAIQAGKLLGSDYLSGGGFIVMDTEVLLDITLIDVETGRVISFSSRGNSEDIIHLAAEKIARELTGKRHFFRTAETDRPIIKQALLPPGELRFFSHLIDARIYIDDEFYGYTPGDSRVPTEIELSAGEHSIGIDLGPNFGIVIEPEISFEKWRGEFTVESGKTIVIEDPTRHFNDRLYDLQKVLREDKTIYLPSDEIWVNQYDFNFTDRLGMPVTGSLTMNLSPTGTGGLNARAMLIYNHERHVFTLECPAEEEIEFEKTIGFIDLDIELDCRYSDRADADWDIWRNDVYQGMHRE